jgi:malate synthase
MIANWLHHQVIDKAQVKDCLREMSQIVDEQNSRDKTYIGYNNQDIPLEHTIAFKAARDLILYGVQELNGHTEKVLHSRRVLFKATQQ